MIDVIIIHVSDLIVLAMLLPMYCGIFIMLADVAANFLISFITDDGRCYCHLW